MTIGLATRPPDVEAIERVLVGGDLSGLSPAQRVSYYNQVCDSLGLNPLTKPFAFLKLSGKEVLYALRDATEQLRKLHGVSITEIHTQHFNDVYIVTAKATDKTGRTDVSTGVVPLGNLKGETLANALMKAETKAKRRVTLSICGLGMLDETEVDSIPSARAASYTVEPLPQAEPVVVPDGAVLIADIRVGEGPPGSTGTIITNQGEALPVFSEQRLALCSEFCQTQTPVRLDIRLGKKSGKPYLWEAHAWKDENAALDTEIAAKDAEPHRHPKDPGRDPIPLEDSVF